MAYETILTEVRDHVLIITLNRPEARNAMSSQMMKDLSDELERWDNDLTSECALLPIRGHAFAAGAGLKELAAGTHLA